MAPPSAVDVGKSDVLIVEASWQAEDDSNPWRKCRCRRSHGALGGAGFWRGGRARRCGVCIAGCRPERRRRAARLRYRAGAFLLHLRRSELVFGIESWDRAAPPARRNPAAPPAVRHRPSRVTSQARAASAAPIHPQPSPPPSPCTRGPNIARGRYARAPRGEPPHILL